MAGSAVIGALRVNLSADTAAFAAGLTQANKSLQGMAARMQGAISGISRAFAGLGISLGVGALVSGFRNVISEVAALGDAAQRAGVSAEGLQVLRKQLILNGGAAEDADDAMSKFSVRVGQLGQTATGPAAASLKQLGVSVRDASGAMRSNDAIFRDAVDRLAGIDDVSRRSAIAAQLFGKEAGPKMAIALADGTAGLAATEKGMRDLGAVMSNEGVASAMRVDDAFDSLSNTLSQKFKGAVVNAAEAMWFFVDSLKAVENQTVISNLTRELEAVQGKMAGIGSTPRGIPQIREWLHLPTIQDEDKTLTEELHRQENAILDRIGALNQQALSHPKPAFTEFVLPPAAAKIPKLTADVSSAAKGLKSDLSGLKDGLNGMSDAMSNVQDVTQGFFSDFRQGLKEGKSWTDALTDSFGNLADQLIDMALNNAIAGFFANFGGGGFGFGGRVATGAPMNLLKGFARGGTIFAGGSGGIDSQVVAFRKSPSEQVDIHKPGQDRGVSAGSAQVIVNNFAGAEIQPRQERGPDGERLILNIVKKGIASGQLDAPLRARHGLQAKKVVGG